VKPFGFNFGAILVASHDGKPLLESGRIGISIGARFENEGMGWNAERNTVSDQWGQGPVRAEFVPATLRLRVNGNRTVYALDATGKRVSTVPSRVTNGTLQFETLPGAKTVWYEVVSR
jgi:hypothetical protein